MLKCHSILILLIMLAGVPVALAQQDAVKAVISEAAAAGFSELERQIIKKYFGELPEVETASEGSGNKSSKGNKAIPKGLARRDTLPPGLTAQLERNGTLPPGLAKRELPADLNQQLPPVKAGYERSILEDMTVVLVEKATGRIADIINDAITGDDRPINDRRD